MDINVYQRFLKFVHFEGNTEAPLTTALAHRKYGIQQHPDLAIKRLVFGCHDDMVVAIEMGPRGVFCAPSETFLQSWMPVSQ